MTMHTIKNPSFSGRGAQARGKAFSSIELLSFDEDTSRNASLNNMRIVLGTSPDDALSALARQRWVVGRVASRLPNSEVPKGCIGRDMRLAYAQQVVCEMAGAPKPGKKARALRAGQIGRRTPVQERILRAAQEAVSLFWAELGLSGARTMAEKNAKQSAKKPGERAPHHNASQAKDIKPDASTSTALATPAKPITSDDYVEHMQTQLAALCAFDNKYAKKRPTTHGAFAEALRALKQTANAAANAYQMRKAEAEAKAAEKND